MTLDGRLVLMANREPTPSPHSNSTGRRAGLGHGACDGAPRLVFVDEVPCGGENPSDIALADDAVHVANQDSGTITVLALDTDPGLLTRRVGGLAIPSPTQGVARRADRRPRDPSAGRAGRPK